jgi:hypothetical protein
MLAYLFTGLKTLNQLLTAGIAIMAFSLLLYALTFNLRDRVARSFAVILVCVVIVYVGDAIASTITSQELLEILLRFQWVGIIFMPVSYLHFSDALLATTGRPSRGRRRIAIRLMYLVAIIFTAMLPFSWLVGPVVNEPLTAPYLEYTWVAWIFTSFYLVGMMLAMVNLFRTSRRAITRSSKRRMRYLLISSIAPAIGSFPFLLFSSAAAAAHPLIFWIAATLVNMLVSVLLVVMAYSVAFFGVSWPDRIVKRRLFKWIMRGPITASTVLAITTITRRLGEMWGQVYTQFVPILMAGSLILLEYLITLAAPIWERWLFHGGDRENVSLLQRLDERLLTSGDLRQYLEAILTAVCDQLQISGAFFVSLRSQVADMVVDVGNKSLFTDFGAEEMIEQVVKHANGEGDLLTWGNYWLLPLYSSEDEEKELIGLLGMVKPEGRKLDEEQSDSLLQLSIKAAQALVDRYRQEKVFSSLEALTPEFDRIQRMRAAARYDSLSVLSVDEQSLDPQNLEKWVKDALTHYWGGPKLTGSPLIRLRSVQRILQEHEGNPANALRVILRQGIERVRPVGERRFTGEWLLYNILEMKFMEGRKVREIALRLAMSEADLYRKQRVAIESVAKAILEMEAQARDEEVVVRAYEWNSLTK